MQPELTDQIQTPEIESYPEVKEKDREAGPRL